MKDSVSLSHSFHGLCGTSLELLLLNWCVLWYLQVVEDGYEFFAKRQLVTLFSAPNYCGEFDNAGAMMSVDETLMCSFQVSVFSQLVYVQLCHLLNALLRY